MTSIHAPTDQTATAARPAPAVTSSWLTQRRALALLAVALGLILLGNALWLRQDKTPPGWEAARYLTSSLEAFDLIRRPALASLGELIFVRNGVQPASGFVLPTVPFYWLFGVSEDGATWWTQGLALALLLFSVYGIGRRLFDVRVGLLAALLIGLNPEVIRLSRLYVPELAAAAVVSVMVYFLIRSEFLQRRGAVLLAGAALGLAMLQRPLLPLLFAAGPLVFVFIGSLTVGLRADSETSAQRLKRRFLPGLLLFGLPLVLSAGLYYARYGRAMAGSLFGQQAAGTAAPVGNLLSGSPLLAFVATLNASLSWAFQLLFLAGVIVYIGALIRRRVAAPSAILLAWVGVPFLALALASDSSPGSLVALYPPLALLLAFAVFFVFQRSRAAQLVASGAVMALALLTAWQVSWGQPLPQAWASRLAIHASPPSQESWPGAAIIRTLGRLNDAQQPAALSVAAALPNLAEPTLAYYARRTAPNLSLVRQTDPLPTLLEADFVILKTGATSAAPPSTVAEKNAALVSAFLQQADASFFANHRYVGRFATPDGGEAIIYQRTATPSAEQVQAIMAELNTVAAALGQAPIASTDIDRTMLRGQVERGKQLFAEGRYQEALPIFQQVVAANPAIADARQGLGRTLFALGDCDGAVEQQGQAVQLLPINGTFTVFGDMLRECGRVDEAIAAYQRAVELDPQDVRTHFVLAQAYMAQGRTEEAIREFNTTLELDKSGEFTDRTRRFLQQLQPS